MDNFAYLAASALCIGAIACLASQKTARLGNILVGCAARNITELACSTSSRGRVQGPDCLN